MSLFRIVKYSSIIFFLGKYRNKLFRALAVLLFAGITSLLYQDVAEYLQLQHPGTVIYALAIKIIIVYGALGFVLWQFRPDPESDSTTAQQNQAATRSEENRELTGEKTSGPLASLEDVGQKDKLRSRYEGVLKGEKHH